jgi:hypothetical protein
MSLSVAAEGKAPPLSMTRRLEILKPLVEQAFREHGRLPAYTVTVGAYPELKARLAVAAASSGKWSLASGKPKTGNAGAFVKELLASEKLYPELESFFDSFGYGVSISSVEEVMLCHWKEIKSEATSPRQPDIRAESLLPCGASLVFRILKRQEKIGEIPWPCFSPGRRSGTNTRTTSTTPNRVRSRSWLAARSMPIG